MSLKTRFLGLAAVLIVAAGSIGLMGLVPGMPNLVFLSIAGILGSVAWLRWQRSQAPPVAAAVEERCSSPVGMKRWLLPPWSLIDAKGDAPLMSTRPSGCTRKA